MSNVRNVFIGICLSSASIIASAQSANEHEKHHPVDATSSASGQKQVPAKPPQSNDMAAMESHMKAMQAVHDKMSSAKSPEERQALMAEHMKLMQEGMGMMMNRMAPPASR